MSRWMSLAILLVIIVVAFLLLYRVMASFLLPLFLAAVLTVIFRPVHNAILGKCQGRPVVAAAATTVAILLVVFLPLVGVLGLAVHEGLAAISGDVLDQAEMQVQKLRKKFGWERPFRVIVAKDGTVYILTDVERRLRQLPHRLPEPDEIDRMFRDDVSLLAGAFAAWQDRIASLLPQAQSDPVARDEDPPEMDCLKRIIARGNTTALEALAELTRTFSEAATYMGDPTAFEEPAIDDLRKRFARVKALYESFRIDLLGGPMRAGLIDLANPSDDQLEGLRARAETYLRSWLPSFAGQATAIVGNLLLGLAIMTISVFYFLKDGPGMVLAMMRLSPLDDRYETELLQEFDSVSRAVVLATLLSAVVQGILASVAYLLAGFQPVFLLTMLTILLAMVPFVGAAAVWVPACLWLAFVDERLFAAGVLFAYCATVVSMVDNVVKPFILHGQSKLHPLLALLSVLGGVQALGPIGILVGPMVVSFVQALLNILQHELESFQTADASAKSP